MTLLRPAALALIALVPVPALAETTPEAVWALMQEGVDGLSATASRRGDALVLTHGRVEMDDGPALILPEITLRQLPDGAVVLELPPRFPLVLDLPPKAGDPESLTLQVSAPDLAATFRDIGPEAVDVSLRAGSVSASLDPIKPTLGVTAPPDLFVALAAADLALDWKSNLPERAEAFATGQLSLGTLHFEMRADIPDERAKGSFAIDLSAVKADLDGFLPAGGVHALEGMEGMEGQDNPPIHALLDLLDRGMRLKAGVRHGLLALVADVPDTPDGPVAMDLTAASGDGMLSFDRKGLAYDIGASTVAMAFRGRSPEIPLDRFALTAGEVREALRLDFPIDGVPSPGWRVLYRFAGITVSDEVWDLADPGRSLPRDPMSLVLDTAGTYPPDPRLLSPGGWTPGPQDLPVTDLTLTLTEALVEGAGLRIAGTGDLAFDFADRSRYVEEVPMPEGKLSFLTTGANALIDRLAKLGLMSEDEVSGMRFGLLFLGRAVPGQEDHLATELEFRGGSFLLNGQKIR